MQLEVHSMLNLNDFNKKKQQIKLFQWFSDNQMNTNLLLISNTNDASKNISELETKKLLI